MGREPAKTTLVNVQLLRAIAAALIVIVHLRNLFPYDAAQDALFRYGFAGVDLFFVISGFIMVVTTARRPPSAPAFWLHRICRVVPLYYLATFLVFVIANVAPTVFNSSSANLGDLVKSLLFIPFEKSPDRIYPLYFLGWTLNYEMFFYALFGGAILLRPNRRVLLCSLVILGAVGAGAIADATPQSNLALYVYSRPIMLDFVLGMVIGHFYPTLIRLGATIDTRTAASVLIGLALLLFGVLPPSPSTVAPVTNTFISFGIPSACILLAMVMLEAGGNRVRSPVLLALGDSSYSMYLFHYFVVGAFVAANRQIDQPLPMAILAFLVVCATSVLIFRTVEKPLVGLSKHALSDAAPRLAASLFDVGKQRRRIQAAIARFAGGYPTK